MVIKKVPWQVLGHDHERSGAAYLVLASGDLGLKDAEADFSHSHHNSEDGISNFKTNNKKSSKFINTSKFEFCRSGKRCCLTFFKGGLDGG